MAEKQESAEATVRTIRRETWKKYLAEEKVLIVLERLHGDLLAENWSSLHVIAGLGQVSWTTGGSGVCQERGTPRNRSSASSERPRCSLVVSCQPK